VICQKESRTSSSAVAVRFTRADARPPRSSRPLRKFLALALSSLTLSAVALPASASWWTSSPTLTIGSTSINVRNAGARGDGVHDDTAAFQAAINSLPSSGGTITVPAGTYRINALKSINMRSHTRLKLDPLAQLVAIPNNQTRSYVIKAWRVNNVEIVGGSIVGERVRHIGTTGEWGMGVDIRASSKVFVHNTKVSNCWGDGLYIGALGSSGSAVPSTDVTVSHVTSSNNRRQGLSFGPVQRVYILASTFANTNGTAPQAGIDVEPSTQGKSTDIRIEGSWLVGNQGNGLEVHAHVAGLAVVSSTLKGNHGFGVLSVDGASSSLSKNVITQNGLDGVGMTATSNNWQIIGNTITYNSTRWFIAHNKSIFTLTSSNRDVQISSTTRNIYLASNTLSPKP
jgi:hypothetical protein